MSKLPDFEGLAMFAKVAEEGSFAAAARVMGVSVPTVSRAVARLEERLLTEFGLSMAAKAGDIYRQAEEVESEAQELSVQPRGQVRLAIPMAFGLRWVAPLLPELIRRYPELSVDLHLSDASVDLIADGFDAALRIAALPDSSLVARLWNSTVARSIRVIWRIGGASVMPIGRGPRRRAQWPTAGDQLQCDDSGVAGRAGNCRTAGIHRQRIPGGWSPGAPAA